ncbi:terminase large subunit, partial [Klebsiella pneumoniae]
MATVADGFRYAERVVSGDIVAGELVRLACQRFFHDLEHGPERGVYFDEGRAQHVLDFYNFVPHVKGHLTGKPIELMDWHTFILINLFGFVVPLIDEITFESILAYDEVARKNAKSTLSSGIGLYMTGADGEGGSEVYSAATTRDQARIVFDDAKRMIKLAPKTLGRLFGSNKLNIHQERTGSKFEPVASDANNLDGLNIHCGIVDELHAHKTRDVWEVLETATGARLQSLIFAITTAGFNKEGICYEQRDYAIKVLKNFDNPDPLSIKDDSYFALIYTLDEGDDPFDEANWPKANPGLGICKRWDDMRRLAKKAKEQVAARVGFFTKHLNIWVQGEKAWMDMARWEKCRDDWDDSTSANWSMWLGVDLSNKIDISAAVKVWLAPNGDVYVRSRFWIPEGRLEACSKQQADLYRKWNLAGFLEFTDGDVVDHAVIKEETIEWARGNSLNEFAYDPW